MRDYLHYRTVTVLLIPLNQYLVPKCLNLGYCDSSTSYSWMFFYSIEDLWGETEENDTSNHHLCHSPKQGVWWLMFFTCSPRPLNTRGDALYSLLCSSVDSHGSFCLGNILKVLLTARWMESWRAGWFVLHWASAGRRAAWAKHFWCFVVRAVGLTCPQQLLQAPPIWWFRLLTSQ